MQRFGAVGESASSVFPPLHVDTPDGERFLQRLAGRFLCFALMRLHFTSKIVEHSCYLLPVKELMAYVCSPRLRCASRVCHDEKVALAGLSGLRAHPRLLLLAFLIAGIAPLFGFTALALGLVGYVTPIFKRSALFTILWAKLFLGEGQIRERLLGATVMMGGGRHGGCLRTPPLMKNRKDGTRQIFSPRVSFHLMKEYSSLWYFRHSKAFPRFQTKRYASGNDGFLFSVFCRIPEKTGNTGAEKLRGRTHPMTHGVYLLYRLFKDSSKKSYGEEKPNRYSTNNTTDLT